MLSMMEQHGYSYCAYPRDGIWKFTKTGEKERTFIINRYDFHAIFIEMRLSNSYRHQHIGIPKDYWDRQSLPQNGTLGGWIFENQGELDAVIRLIAQGIAEIGFAIFETAANDPLDIGPTREMEEDLYRNHRRYTEKFAKQYGLQDWKPESVIHAINQAMLHMPQEINLNRDKDFFMELASSYGAVFEAYNSEWTIYQNKFCAIIVHCGSKMELPIVINLLSPYFHCVHSACPEHIEHIIRNNLKTIDMCNEF